MVLSELLGLEPQDEGFWSIIANKLAQKRDTPLHLFPVAVRRMGGHFHGWRYKDPLVVW